MVASAEDTSALYLDLLERCLTGTLAENLERINPGATGGRRVLKPLRWLLRRAGLAPVRDATAERLLRAEGRDWPAVGETMVGLTRLRNVRACVTDVVRAGVPGDLIETGVWRGGVTIMMRAVLKSFGDRDRRVWVADSFSGLPRPDPRRWPDDRDEDWWRWSQLAIPLEQVKQNFERYGLLDDQVQFLPGWFEDTLPTAPIERLAVLRLDGDMYGSTMVALESLYPKLSPGGYLIVDDYGAVQGCRQAVLDFRARLGINEPLQEIDWTGVYWQRTS